MNSIIYKLKKHYKINERQESVFKLLLTNKKVEHKYSIIFNVFLYLVTCLWIASYSIFFPEEVANGESSFSILFVVIILSQVMRLLTDFKFSSRIAISLSTVQNSNTKHLKGSLSEKDKNLCMEVLHIIYTPYIINSFSKITLMNKLEILLQILLSAIIFMRGWRIEGIGLLIVTILILIVHDKITHTLITFTDTITLTKGGICGNN